MQDPSSNLSRIILNSMIVIPAIYLALHQYSPTRALTVVALGRNRGCALAKAMEGDREIRRQMGFRLKILQDSSPE